MGNENYCIERWDEYLHGWETVFKGGNSLRTWALYKALLEKHPKAEYRFVIKKQNNNNLLIKKSKYFLTV